MTAMHTEKQGDQQEDRRIKWGNKLWAMGGRNRREYTTIARITKLF